MTPGGFPFPYRKCAPTAEEEEAEEHAARERDQEGEEEEIEGPDPTARGNVGVVLMAICVETCELVVENLC